MALPAAMVGIVVMMVIPVPSVILDLLLTLEVRPHHLFWREGEDLHLDVPVTVPEAVRGASVEVPTLEGPQSLTIEPGTQNGDVFTLRGQGIADPRTRSKGDLLVQVFIEVAKKLSNDQERLLRELAELDHESVLPHRTTFLEKLRNFFDPDTDPDES